jgi:hypothetical protein
MFHSIYSRRAYKGDGVGGWIVYKSGGDARINASVAEERKEFTDYALPILIGQDLKVSMRKNTYYECLEVVITKQEPRWQDEQHIQVIGEDLIMALQEAFVVWYRFFYEVDDWIREADELETQDLPPEGSQINSDAALFAPEEN